MSVAQFLTNLFESGKVAVLLPSSEPIIEDITPILQDAEKVFRQNLAGEPPEFSPTVSIWAAHLFYSACQFLVCRDIGMEAIKAEFATPCPSPHSPSTDYSVDPVFQFLPDLIH